MDTASFVWSVNTDDICKHLQNLINLSDFSKKESWITQWTKTKKVLGKFKVETPENIWKDGFLCLNSKLFAIKITTETRINWKVFKNHN